MRTKFGLIIFLLISNFSICFGQEKTKQNYFMGYKKVGQGLVFHDTIDNSFKIKIGIRFQTLFNNVWTVKNDNIGQVGQHTPEILIRRARFKMDGSFLKNKIYFKFELGLSPRDIRGGDDFEHGNTASIILDAFVGWNINKNFWLQVGQGKLPGNRERLISSGSLEFVDRSLLNSRFNIDRDIGVQIGHKWKKGNFFMKEIIHVSKGEGRNVIATGNSGLNYTGKIEIYPMGEFTKKGDYFAMDLLREEKPKLAIATAFNFNNNAIRERGQLGDFIKDANDNYFGKNHYQLFADLMFKYKGFSIMTEYAQRWTNGSSIVMDDSSNVIGTVYTGKALNVQMGYVTKSNFGFSLRYTGNDPDSDVGTNVHMYTFCFSKFFFGHKLKIQSDFSYLQNISKDDNMWWRLQVEFHL